MNQNAMDVQKIDYRFKIMYALGMVFIVAGHCGNGGVSLLYDWFPPYAFHLGLFAFVSGYFYKDDAVERVGAYLLKKGKKLLLPLYLWNFFYALLVAILSYFGFTIGAGVTMEKLLLQPITWGLQFVYNMGGWFVVPLFMLHAYNILLRKLFCLIKINMSEWIYFLVSLLLGFGGVYMALIGLNTGWWLVLVRLLYFIPFYELGILYKKKLENYDKLNSIYYFAVIFLIQLIIAYRYGRIPWYSPADCNFTDGPMLPFVIGFTGIAFWLRISKIIAPMLGENKYIRLISDNTYSIMIHQFLGFMLLKTVFALASKYTPFFGDFNWGAYKSEIYYYYLPHGIDQMKILYMIVGLAFPILIQLCQNKIVSLIKDRKKRLSLH